MWGLLVPGGCLLLAMGCLLIPFKYKPEIAIVILLSATIFLPLASAWGASMYKLEGHKPSVARRAFQMILYWLASTFVMCSVGSVLVLVIAIASATSILK